MVIILHTDNSNNTKKMKKYCESASTKMAARWFQMDGGPVL